MQSVACRRGWVLSHAFEREALSPVPAIRYVTERQKALEFLTRAEATWLLGKLPEHLSRMDKFSLATGLREANVRLPEWR